MNKITELELAIYLIDLPNRGKCLKLLRDNKSRFEESPGSLTKHQAWKGGYVDHLNETMQLAVLFYGITNPRRKHPFKIGDVMLILFLHDLEKPWKYIEPKMHFESDLDKEVFINGLIDKYKIILTPAHKNALKYIHGEGDDFSPTERIQGPLAAFCHICDVFSARIWFNYPEYD